MEGFVWFVIVVVIGAFLRVLWRDRESLLRLILREPLTEVVSTVSRQPVQESMREPAPSSVLRQPRRIPRPIVDRLSTRVHAQKLEQLVEQLTEVRRELDTEAAPDPKHNEQAGFELFYKAGWTPTEVVEWMGGNAQKQHQRAKRAKIAYHGGEVKQARQTLQPRAA